MRVSNTEPVDPDLAALLATLPQLTPKQVRQVLLLVRSMLGPGKPKPS